MKPTLLDTYQRQHDYLRISLLERCNLRCTYCMPENGIPLRDKKEFMSQEELFEIVNHFVAFGVKKIRLTGGEPLIKKNFKEILAYLALLDVKLHITTNGILLDQYWEVLKSAKLESLNISIDSLQKSKFNSITRRNYFDRVFNNIEQAIEHDFKVKLNVVLIRGFNDNEIIDFIEFGKEKNVTIRFIEFMPFDGNEWDRSKTVDYKEILEQARNRYDVIEPLENEANFTARNFKIPGYKGAFGIISSISNPFCDSCNRIRLTADGKIKNCLFSNEETDLLSALRNNKDIVPLIEQSILSKKKERAGLRTFDDQDFTFENRSMTAIGG